MSVLGLPVSGLVILISVIVVVIIVVGVIFLVRSGNKNKGTATGSNADWQRQAQPGAWNQQGGWGQQGQWGAANGAAQAGNWAGASQNPWGAPAQQQQYANPWGAPAQQQQPANPWEAAPAPAATSQDAWGQQQAAPSQQPAWGTQANTSEPVQQGQQGAAAFGASSPSPAGWGQSQQADPWGSPAASPVAQSAGLQAAGSAGFPSWQQGSVGASGAGNEGDKTMLRPAGQPGPQSSAV